MYPEDFLMKTSFRQVLNSSCMVVESDAALNDFQVKMLENNTIPGLLKFGRETFNGCENFLYDITSRYSFSKTFEAEKITYPVLKSLVVSLKDLADLLAEYLLDFRQLLFLPECIFVNRERNRFYFCYFPEAERNNAAEMKLFFNALLSLIDYDDSRAVTLAFNLNKISQAENFTPADLWGAVEKSPPPQEVVSPAPAPLPQPQTAPQKPRQTGFFEKFKAYASGKDFSEIFDDINSGKIIKKIKEFTPDPVPDLTQPPFTVINDDIAYAEISLTDTMPINRGDLFTRRLCGLGKIGDLSVEIKSFPFSIGKSRDNDLCLEDSTVSRIHCRIYEDESSPGCYLLEDLNSLNGTFINEEKLPTYTRQPLKCGDTIRAASCELRFR